MSTEQNAMDKALAAAKAAADQAPAVIDHTPSTPAAPAKGGSLTLDDFKRETSPVDAWVKTAVDGFTLRDEEVAGGRDAKLRVVMCLEDLVVCKRLRYGNPATYKTSYDGVYSTEGELWSVVLDNARRATGDTSVKDYMSMNVQGRLLEDAGGATAGDTIGYQTTPTQNKNINSLIKTAEAAGIDREDEFEVLIGIEKRTKGSNTWAVQTYEFVGPYDG